MQKLLSIDKACNSFIAGNSSVLVYKYNRWQPYDSILLPNLFDLRVVGIGTVDLNVYELFSSLITSGSAYVIFSNSIQAAHHDAQKSIIAGLPSILACFSPSSSLSTQLIFSLVVSDLTEDNVEKGGNIGPLTIKCPTRKYIPKINAIIANAFLPNGI